MRIAMITTHPPSKGSLNEYGFHLVRNLLLKPESVFRIGFVNG